MDWRVRTAWWLLVALLLISTVTPTEAGHISGDKGRGSHSSGGHGSGSVSSWNKGKDPGHYSTKHFTQKYGGKAKTTPKTKVHGSWQHTNSSSHRYKPTDNSRRAITEKYNRHHKPTVATPISTTHHHRHGHGEKDHTKPRVSKNNTTNSHNVSSRGAKPLPVHTTLRPHPFTKIPVTSSYNKSRDPFHTGRNPGHVQSTQWPPHPATTTRANSSRGGHLMAVHTTQRPHPFLKIPVTSSYNKSRNQTGRNPGYPQPTQRPPHPTSTTGGTGSKHADYPRPPQHNISYPGHPLGYPGYPGYNNHPTGYPGPQGHYGGFGHHPSTNYSGRGSPWSPPGYTSSFSIMPGVPVRSGEAEHSSPFGYSKNYFMPSSPTIIVLSIPHYDYPSSIPPRKARGCDCYVKDRTAVCAYKLRDDHIPSCVDSSVTAMYIRSKEVDRLAIDAFRNVRHLEYINITGTMLRLLPRDLFRDTPDLKHLLVRRNPVLSSLDHDVFRDASKLEDVFLDRNNISLLERDVFTPLINVRKLNLGYNKIWILPEGIFRDNRELQELRLSGNPVYISTYTARDLLRNNAKLRVLLMRNCILVDLPIDLLRNASNLEWLDLSHNKISMFPLEFIQDSPKLAHLGLAYNKLKFFSSDMLHQRGGSLASLGLEGNPWHCDCDLLPLAGWASFRRDAVRGQPKCSSPDYAEKESLQHWFHSKAAMKCNGATASLRTELNRVLSVARAIAKQGPSFSASLLPISDEEVSFIATNYFLYAMAAQTDTDVNSVVWHWARLLEKVLDRRHLRYTEAVYGKGINRTSLDPLTTTTVRPPAARAIQRPRRLKGFEPLMNFTYIMMNVPENVSKVVDDGIEEELKILFGVISGTNATSPNTTAGLNATTSANGTMALSEKQLVAGLRSELHDVLSTLLRSIDRANWDVAYERYIEHELLTAAKKTKARAGSAVSCVLMQPQLTVLVAFLTLLAQSRV